jgi:GNAT superfamily N-acetyltransferase
VIRAATVADVTQVARVQARAWLRAYADIVDPDAMPSPAFLEERWRARLAEGGREAWVFDQQGTIAGFVLVGPGGDGDGELHAIYVDPVAQGAGVGTALLAHGEDRLRAAGHVRARLWVFDANAHGRAFCERRGWAAVGEPVQPEGWSAPAVRYEREL